MWWARGSKENSYRKDWREKVMKPDFMATKGRQAENQNRERDALEARQGAGYLQRGLWAEGKLQAPAPSLHVSQLCFLPMTNTVFSHKNQQLGYRPQD